MRDQLPRKESTTLRRSNDDVVDWDENELHEESNESHHHKSNRRTHSYFREFLAIGFVTALDETNTALSEISERIDCGINGFHDFFLDRNW